MRSAPMFLAIAGLTVTALAAVPQQADERAATIHLLQRATFGVRPEDVDRVMSLGRNKWLDQQLHPEKIDDSSAAKRLEKFPVLTADMGKSISDYNRAQQERRQMTQAQGMDKMSEEQRQMALDSMRRQEARNLTPEQRRERQRNSPQYMMGELVSAKLTRAAYSERQLEEMMTDFWFNHFNVFFGKGLDRFMIANYEQNAIRPHVFGKFRDLLEATAKHPAMLFYLDNASSVAAPDSTEKRAQRQQYDRFKRMSAAQQEEFLKRRNITREQVERFLAEGGPRQRQRGLNENYAREIMELHTLGVDGGYTQQDIIEVARAFTGWQFTRPGPRAAQPVEFAFRLQAHDRKEKTVLGHKLAANRGIEDGEDVLDILARHPSTAKFISRKLVERFVSDTPSPELVNELAAVFTKTDGDLREVTRALFSSPRFYAANVRRSKVKTPFELVASALRVTNAEVALTLPTVQMLRSLGHLPYNEPAPTGFPASSEDWVNSGAMLNRMNFGLALAAGRLEGIKLDPKKLFGDVPAQNPEAALPTLLARLMPGVNTTKLQQTIVAELAKPVEETAAETPQMDRQRRAQMQQGGRGRGQGAVLNTPVRNKGARALGLALGSPDFQRK